MQSTSSNQRTGNPAASWRRALALCLLSLSVILGLMSMHSFASAEPIGESAAAHISQHEQGAHGAHASAPAPDAPAPQAPEHCWAQIAGCVLLLVVALVLLRGPTLLVRLRRRLVATRLHRLLHTARLALEPPDLNRLCISRT
ncbi:hypothetical protein [Glutamicibacter endophyticus]|uniref:hypothetical protein n=1 Tax=Glutamicibacter endophyticus TaxID=1522174 RepID=UPI003AF0B976